MKIYPDFETFRQLYGEFPVVPVYGEILGDLETPVSAFMKIRKGSYNFLLESAEQEEKTGRYSFLGTSPEFTVKGKGRKGEIYFNLTGERKVFEMDKPAGILDDLLAGYRSPSYPGLPGFTGGLIGYFSYDFVRQMEKLPDISPAPESEPPDFFFMFAKDVMIFDHFRRKIIFVSNVSRSKFGSADDAYRSGSESILSAKKMLDKTLFLVDSQGTSCGDGFESNFSRPDFEAAVEKAREYIKSGDIIQAVLSQRWEKKLDVAPFNIYRSLRSVNPSPYMFFIEAGDTRLVGSSPEILVKLDRGRVTLRPIAGTRPRDEDEARDRELEMQLLSDEKEKAEHVMLVDLGRNDLGRICVPGTVRVSELMKVERYSHVMHMVSNVEGRLRSDATPSDVIKASFPAGTVSGAPRIRAMEIIEEIEPSKRGLYAGAVGYFSLQNHLDFCIAIRTFVIRNDKVSIQAGAGIVADSVPEREYEETCNKAKGLMEAYRKSSLI